MQLLERFQFFLLQHLSRKVGTGRFPNSCELDNGDSLTQLKSMYPGFLDQIKGKSIVDFGCGEGRQAFALAKTEATRVVGVDINKALVESARVYAEKNGVTGVIYYERSIAKTEGAFDCVLSHNSMEHFSDALETISYFKRLIRTNGEIFITFGPPWYSPYGAHTQFFTRVPWIHLLFSEKVVLSVRNNYTNDVADCYEDVRGGLNRMSLEKFHKLIEIAGLRIVYQKYIYMFGCRFLYYIPVLRELCLWHLSVKLKYK